MCECRSLLTSVALSSVSARDLRSRGYIARTAERARFGSRPSIRAFPVKLYPEELLPDFRKHVRDVWLPEHATDYFRKRDGIALQYLPKVISLAKPTPVAPLLPGPRR
jgi:hypothetical protein